MKKHESIASDLTQKIKSGILRASERLRSQSELAQEYGVSVGTVQKSLRHLESSGLVVSVHGSGTYVTTGSPKIEEFVNWRFLDENDRVLPGFAKVEEVKIIEENGPWRDHLGEAKAIRVKRIVSIDLQFVAYSTVYLSPIIFDSMLSLPPYQLDGFELTKSINDHGLESDHFVYRIHGEELSDRLCTLNHLSPKTRGMYWEIYGFTIDGQPNWYQVIECPLTKYSLEIFVFGKENIKRHLQHSYHKDPIKPKQVARKRRKRSPPT